MPLQHEFHLLPQTVDRLRQFRDLFEPKTLMRERRQRPTPSAVLSDDLFGYLGDSFAWVPSEHLAAPGVPASGFDLYWYTAISGDGARVLASVMRAWAALFENGHATIELTGRWGGRAVVEGAGRYERLVFSRAPLVASLRALAGLAEQASGTTSWLLHAGI